jgi:hypothetical protein
MIASQQMSEPAFDQLRTKEQLGYIVFTGIKRLNQQYLALHLIVQSSHKDADFLDGRVEDFLGNYREQLLALTEDAFAANVAAVIEKLVEKPKNIDQVCVCLVISLHAIFVHLCVHVASEPRAMGNHVKIFCARSEADLVRLWIKRCFHRSATNTGRK